MNPLLPLPPLHARTPPMRLPATRGFSPPVQALRTACQLAPVLMPGRPAQTAAPRPRRAARRRVATEKRQPARCRTPCLATTRTWRRAAGEGADDRPRLPCASDAERAVPDARREQHRGADAGGSGEVGGRAHQARRRWREVADGEPPPEDGDRAFAAVCHGVCARPYLPPDIAARMRLGRRNCGRRRTIPTGRTGRSARSGRS